MKRILLIEDETVVATIYQNHLRKAGYEVVVANDGAAGLQGLSEHQPDAVLLDVMLPMLNGLEVLKKMRAQPEFARTPVFVLTSSFVPATIDKALTHGAIQVFNKATVTPTDLIEWLQHVVPLPAGAADAAASALDQRLAVTIPAPSADAGSKAGDTSDPEAQALHTFLANRAAVMALLRKSMQEVIRAPAPEQRQTHLLDLYRHVHTVTGGAGFIGWHAPAKLAGALEVLVKEMQENLDHVNASTLRTMANAMDVLQNLLSEGVADVNLDAPPPTVVALDDEPLARRAICRALEKVGLNATDTDQPEIALRWAASAPFDLVFADVQMEPFSGYEFCRRLRSLPGHKETPVVFVTCLNDLHARASSTLSGGTDFIAKPFLFIELGVKALSYLMRRRLAQGSGRQAA